MNFRMAVRFIRRIILIIIIGSIVGSAVFIWYKGNRPMRVPQAPKELTYWGFLADRFDAAKIVQPTRCGWGMISSLVILGPIYSVLYTNIAINPHGFLARITAPDPDIPKNVVGANWYEIPGIWWNIVERLSWTMLGKQHPGCRFRSVKLGYKNNIGSITF